MHGITVPNSGHFIPEEQPEFVIKQLFKFFGGNNTTNTTNTIKCVLYFNFAMYKRHALKLILARRTYL